MKRLTLWLTSILIALGLLCAAGIDAVSQPSPSPRVAQSDAKKSEPGNGHTEKKRDPSTEVKPTTEEAPAAQLQESTNQNRNSTKQKGFQWPNAANTTNILLAIFTFLLVVVGALQVGLMKIAFDNDRPVIVVSKLLANPSPWQGFRPTIILRNGGTKPAILVQVVGHIHSHQRQPYSVPSKPRYQELAPCTIDRSALGPGEETEIGCGTYIPNDEERLQYAAAEKDFAIYGSVSYQRMADLRKRTYETYFFWFYSPPTAQLLPEGGFYMGPPEYNRQT